MRQVLRREPSAVDISLVLEPFFRLPMLMKVKRIIATLAAITSLASVKAADEDFARLRAVYGDAFHLLEVDGLKPFVLLPRVDPTRYRAFPWVWYAPAIKGNPHPCDDWLFQRLLAHGIAVAGIDVGETYANPRARAQFSLFYQTVCARFHLATRATLLAQSRGGLNHYLFAAAHPGAINGSSLVKSISGIPYAAAALGIPGYDRRSMTGYIPAMPLIAPGCAAAKR